MTKMGHMQLELEFGSSSERTAVSDGAQWGGSRTYLAPEKTAQLFDLSTVAASRRSNDASRLYEKILASVRHFA